MIDLTLPLTDIHRHLDGNIRAQTILDLGRQYNLALPANTLETLRPHVQVTSNEPDLVSFLSKLDWGVKMLASLDACRRVAYENLEDAARNGLHYVELRFSPRYMAMTHQLPVAGVVEAVIAGVKEGSRDFNVEARLIGILSRTFGEAACEEELEALLAHRDGITALDLAGDELGFPGNLFMEHFRRARDAGWRITVHAGEAAGPESIWQAIRELGAERIGHGVKAVQDPALMDYLAAQRIGIESCLTSNIQTSTVPSLARHPLKTFLEHGVLACINTDDPRRPGRRYYPRIYGCRSGCRPEPRADSPGADQRPGTRLFKRRGKSSADAARSAGLIDSPVINGGHSTPGGCCRRDDLIQTQRRSMSGRLEAKLNQLHNLNRLACRNRISAASVKCIANSGIIGRIVTRQR
ncbi:adenosine deaminase [Klebsiella oxytoca]|nr:adenosine deaminase [Klebsiella oxytoca]